MIGIVSVKFNAVYEVNETPNPELGTRQYFRFATTYIGFRDNATNFSLQEPRQRDSDNYILATTDLQQPFFSDNRFATTIFSYNMHAVTIPTQTLPLLSAHTEPLSPTLWEIRS